MARVIEDVLVIKVSKILRDNDNTEAVLTDDMKDALNSTIPQLLDEVINDRSVIVELAGLD